MAPTPTTVTAIPTTKPTAVRTAASATHPGGYAQVFIGARPRSDANDATRAQTRLAQSPAPDIELPDPAPMRNRLPSR